MPKDVSYRYRLPFVPPRRAYLKPAWPVALLILVSVLFVATHQPLLTADSPDPVRAGDVTGDSRAALWVDEACATAST